MRLIPLFLICALALSPKPLTVYDLLVDLVRSKYPGAHIVVTPDRDAIIPFYEKTPFVFQGQNVWVKKVRRGA